MRIYLASNWGSKKRMAALAEPVRQLGHVVISSWLSDQTEAYNIDSPRDAYADLGEITSCDLLILDTAESSVTGGREVEMGFALGRGIQVWIIGPERNIFHGIAARRYYNWVDALKDLAPGKSGGIHARV